MTGPVFVCNTPRECFADTPHPNVCSSCMPILRAREGGWLPAAMELSTGPLWRRDMFRIRIQSFIGVAVFQMPETVGRAKCLVLQLLSQSWATK